MPLVDKTRKLNTCNSFLPNEHVVGDVVQVTAVFQPWTGRRNVIGGTFSLHFDQNGKIRQIFAVPFVEWFQQLQSLTLRVDINFDAGAILRNHRSFVSFQYEKKLWHQWLELTLRGSA